MPREFETPVVHRRVRLDKLELTEGHLKLTFIPQGPAVEHQAMETPPME